MRTTVVSVVALGLVMCGCPRPTELVPNAPAIEVDPLALDFGPVPVGLPANLPLQIKNISLRELRLNASSIDGADYAGPSSAVTLIAGQTLSVQVTFTPTQEGQRDAVLHLTSDADNDRDVAVALTGIGVARLVCADCNSPPANYCASSSVLITYQPHGTCVNSRCEYQASNVICGGTCVEATGRCSGTPLPDAGTPDAGCVPTFGQGCTRSFRQDVPGCDTNYGCAAFWGVYYNSPNGCDAATAESHVEYTGPRCTYVGFSSTDPFKNTPNGTCINSSARGYSIPNTYTKVIQGTGCTYSKVMTAPGAVNCAGQCI